MILYLFSDLDDTLFQTRRKCKAAQDGTDPELLPAAYGRDGNPLSFMLPGQRALFSLADERMRVVPITARNLDSFRRVRLPFRHGAILNYGATILKPDGGEDTVWREKTLALLKAAEPMLHEAMALMRSVIRNDGLSSTARLIGDPASGIPFYALSKNPDRNAAQLQRIREELERDFRPATPWRLHHNDNNLAVIPACLDKAVAVDHFIRTWIAEPRDGFMTLGMGDSIEDINFMNLCDYAIIPSQSQIARRRLEPGATVRGAEAAGR